MFKRLFISLILFTIADAASAAVVKANAPNCRPELEDEVLPDGRTKQPIDEQLANSILEFLTVHSQRLGYSASKPYSMGETFVRLIRQVHGLNSTEEQTLLKLPWGKQDYQNTRSVQAPREKIIQAWEIFARSLIPAALSGQTITTSHQNAIVQAYKPFSENPIGVSREPLLDWARLYPRTVNRKPRGARGPNPTAGKPQPRRFRGTEGEKQPITTPTIELPTINTTPLPSSGERSDLLISFSDDMLIRYPSKVSQMKKSFSGVVVLDEDRSWTILYADRNGKPQGYFADVIFEDETHVEVTDLTPVSPGDAGKIKTFWEKVASERRISDKQVNLKAPRVQSSEWEGTLVIPKTTSARSKYRSGIELEFIEHWISGYVLQGIFPDGRKVTLVFASDERTIRLNTIPHEGVMVVTSAE